MQSSIKGLKINYEAFGDGECIVLLHGWGGSLKSLRRLGELLGEKGYKILLIDLPGFGKSEKPNGSFALDDYAEVVELLIGELDIGHCIVFGHSFGGSVALKLALRKKINIKKLILCNSSGIRKKSQKVKNLEKVAKFAKQNTDIPIIKDIYQFFRKLFYYYILRERDYIDHPELTDTFKSVINEDLTSELSKIDIPTLLIWGELDRSTPLKHGQILAREIGNSRLEVVKDEGHGLPKLKPEKIVKFILEFIAV